MKIELCHFSQQKIYPSRGKKYIRIDGKVFNFANGKSEKSFFMKRNPREIRWTVLYRRKHKKGTIEEQNKKRSRKSHKFSNRAYQGITIDQIMQKRNQTTEVRKAQRDQAIRAAKEKAAAKKKTKIQAASKLAQKSQQSKAKVPKVVSKGGAGRTGARR